MLFKFSNRYVPRFKFAARIRALAAEYEVKFLETSAKHDINVSETFTAIAREVVARIPAEGAASTRGATRLSGTSGKKKSSCCG